MGSARQLGKLAAQGAAKTGLQRRVFMAHGQQGAPALTFIQSEWFLSQQSEDLLRRFDIPSADQPRLDGGEQPRFGCIHVGRAGLVANELKLDEWHGGSVTEFDAAGPGGRIQHIAEG